MIDTIQTNQPPHNQPLQPPPTLLIWMWQRNSCQLQGHCWHSVCVSHADTSFWNIMVIPYVHLYYCLCHFTTTTKGKVIMCIQIPTTNWWRSQGSSLESWASSKLFRVGHFSHSALTIILWIHDSLCAWFNNWNGSKGHPCGVFLWL